MKLLTVVGARPQFIKAAAISRRLQDFKQNEIQEQIVHTGQHYDEGMSDVFFRELDIPTPRWNLGAGQAGDHGQNMGTMISGIDEVISDYRPDCMLVYGDTNSTLAGAISAAKMGLRLAHVEAGLRSFRRGMPEEVNRVVTDRVSDFLFCPTDVAVSHLRNEGRTDHVYLVGDVMFDVFKRALARIDNSAPSRYGMTSKQYVLATIHRAENTDDVKRLTCIFEALGRVSQVLPVLLPLHPRTRRALDRERLVVADAIKVTEPLPYQELVSLMVASAVVATDSGGMQKEAYFSEAPCVTLRDETEWIETVEQGWNVLAPPTNASEAAGNISAAIIAAANKPPEKQPPAIYGNGDAAGEIIQTLRQVL
ncbi:MAG: UDP-N-acetylglucosamine 2-epimerase (non-hydrolyzing) [Pseudomonadota bacterium]